MQQGTMSMDGGFGFNANGPADLENSLWYNPKTGDSFTVSQSIFEGSNFYLITTNGRRISGQTLQNYVQWDKGTPLPAKPMQSQPAKADDLPPEVAALIHKSNKPAPVAEVDPNKVMNQDSADYSGIDPEDLAAMGISSDGVQGVQGTPAPRRFEPHQFKPQPVPSSPNASIIERALGKTPTPDCSMKLQWKEFPRKEISALIDIMGVDASEIADYFFNRFNAELDAFRSSIRDNIRKYIDKELNIEESKPADESAPAAEPAPEPTPRKVATTPKKVTKRASKKVAENGQA